MQIVAVLVLLGCVACARHVVVNPAEVDRLNDREWKVSSEPKTPRGEAPSPAPAPTDVH